MSNDFTVEQIRPTDLRCCVDSCNERLRNRRPIGYRLLLAKERPSRFHNIWRGVASVNIFGSVAHRSFIGFALDEHAIADDWYMIGDDICSAIVSFDNSCHGPSAEWKTKSESEPRTDPKVK